MGKKEERQAEARRKRAQSGCGFAIIVPSCRCRNWEGDSCWVVPANDCDMSRIDALDFIYSGVPCATCQIEYLAEAYYKEPFKGLISSQ